jgi:hypothetical protein
MKHKMELLKLFSEIQQTSKEEAKITNFDADYIALKLLYLASEHCDISYCFYNKQQSKIQNP